MKRKYTNTRISRGYRLRKSTHDLLKNMQLITGDDCDTIIETACRLYYTDYLKKVKTEIKPKNGSSAKC